jgi:hypothetical protein
MQMLRGCLPIIGYFAELQERHAMTQTSEPGINSEHSEGERTRGNGVVAEVPEFWIIDDELWQAVKTRQSEIADKYVSVTEAIREAQSNWPNGLRRVARSRWVLRIPRSVLMARLPIAHLSKTSPSCAALQRSPPLRRQS